MTVLEMNGFQNSEPINYIYPPSHNLRDTVSVASYEEIFTLPRKPYGKEHTYISFEDPLKPQYHFDEAMSVNGCYLFRKFSCTVSKNILIILIIILFFICTFVALLATNIIQIKGLWSRTPAVPDVIPYEAEEWFVKQQQWGMKRPLKNCKPFQQVTKISLKPLCIDNQDCNDIKSCQDYLKVYDTNITVQYNKDLEYEFFFGQDRHIFEGRNWNCPYVPGRDNSETGWETMSYMKCQMASATHTMATTNTNWRF
ncbi:hypothetical protein J6590_058798 [Homalodisca vitripennis]|nr:hypothetical protein J6590_058798 [Homalodisca vitripennis]